MADKIRISRRQNYKEQLRLYLNLTKRLNAKLKKLFRKQSIQASSQYAKGILDPDNFTDSYGDELYKILANQYKTAITQGAERVVVQRYKKASESIDKIITDYVAINTAQKVTQISETTRKKLNATIKKGLVDGDSIKDISRNIKNSDSFSTRRATLIARTETHSAMNAGSMEITKTLALNEPVKEWNSAMDERARYYHKSMDGTVIGINESFVVMTPTKYGVVPKRMQYTGDSNGGAANVCNCRCFTSYYDSEDEVIDAVPKKPVIAPDLPIPEELVVVDPITPIKFVGFGRMTAKEKKYQDASWNDSPEKYKQIPAKFPEIEVTGRKKNGAYFRSSDGTLDLDSVDVSINMPKSYIGNNLETTWRHEYAHYADKALVPNLIYKGKFGGFGSQVFDGSGTKVTFKNKVAERATLLDRNAYFEEKLRFSSQVYSKEVLDDAIILEKAIKDKKINRVATRKEFSEYQETIKSKYKTDKFGKLEFTTSQERQQFFEEMVEDGVVFKKNELKILLDNKEYDYDPEELISLNFNNKNGIMGSLKDKEGVFMDLTRISIFDDQRLYQDVGMFSDYLGSITKNQIGYGHTTSYYSGDRYQVSFGARGKVASKQTGEAYAEYISLSGSKNSELWRAKMAEFAPNTKAGFDELTDEMLKLPNLD